MKVNLKGLKAVGYARVSQKDRNKANTSIPNQIALIKDYCKKKGLNLIKIYSEIKSGADEEKARPEFDSLIRDSKKKNFDVIIVKDLDRWTRSQATQEETDRLFEKLGIIFIPIDDPEDEIARLYIGAGNRAKILIARKKTKSLHNLKIQQQIPLNKPPFGYYKKKRIVDNKIVLSKNFLVKNKEAEIVKKIFNYYLDGKPVKDFLYEVGKKMQTIYKILQNKTYCGYFCYKGIWYKGKHESIIDENIFNKVQERLEKNRVKR